MKRGIRKRRYPNGTILKCTRKALRKHPNHFSPDDRYRVTGDYEAEWYKVVDWTDQYSGRTYAAGTVIDTIRKVHDSFVELADIEVVTERIEIDLKNSTATVQREVSQIAAKVRNLVTMHGDVARVAVLLVADELVAEKPIKVVV
jgi:hypothetical protein